MTVAGFRSESNSFGIQWTGMTGGDAVMVALACDLCFREIRRNPLAWQLLSLHAR